MIFIGLIRDFTIKIQFAGIFTMIFVISASKYVSIRNFNEIEDIRFLKLYPWASSTKDTSLHFRVDFQYLVL